MSAATCPDARAQPREGGVVEILIGAGDAVGGAWRVDQKACIVGRDADAPGMHPAHAPVSRKVAATECDATDVGKGDMPVEGLVARYPSSTTKVQLLKKAL